ncbi:hypothetical protein HGRIS_007447 [Hohenbuehelia grisea]|uniref:ATP-binding cassette transporter n=1 Tax=Hohenbuehelia grisea TaxID=104357 RepID=A0ABR3J579_9AGAR
MATLWMDSLLIPAYAAALSFAGLLAHSAYLTYRAPNSDEIDEEDEEGDHRDSQENAENGSAGEATGIIAEIRAHAHFHGGITIFAYKIARLLGCLALLGLTATYLILDEIELEDTQNHVSKPLWSSFVDLFVKPKKNKGRKKLASKLTQQQWLLFTLCLAYFYSSVLALLSLTAKPLAETRARVPRVLKTLPTHLSCLLLLTLAVFCVRDVWPLCTYTLRPLDLPPKHADIPLAAPLLWGHIGVLTLTAVFIPLLSPRPYIPIDKKNPSPVPNAEQTCSLFSLLTYSFLDAIIFKAYRVRHMGFDELPPLADYDRATVLRDKAFPLLDPFSAGNKSTKKRHIFFSIIRVFAKDFLVMVTMVVISVTMGFAAPLGVNRLLHYMETGGEGAFVRPWVWILWLFFGPLIRSTAFQWYIWVSTASVVRAESILTQLVFEHALRIRMRAETDTSSKQELTSTPSSAGGESSNEPQAPIANQEVSSTETKKNFIASTWSRIQSRFVREKSKAHVTSAPKPKQPSQVNLQGKITNLITTDLENITDARNVVYFLVPIPLEIGLCTWFLYAVLGWSSFVGVGAMVLLYPLPGYVGKLLQSVQKERMKRTDARVESVTETVNLIRMIKLFGWEREMKNRISEKREEELVYLRKRQLLEVLNWVVNYAIPLVTMMASYTTYSMTVFDMLRDQLHVILYAISSSIEGKVSLDRLDEFLHHSELLDQFAGHPSQRDSKATKSTNGKGKASDAPDSPNLSESSSSTINAADLALGRPPSGYEGAIGFRDAAFAWSTSGFTEHTESQAPSAASPANGTHPATPSSGRNFVLRIDGELLFRQGHVNLVVGPTGSGKTSLLMALLGEMHFVPAGLESWYQVPRTGGVSYAAQESWVQNETIRDNILFGTPFDEDRYNKVIYQCCLERDLAMFEAGDKTEVGEKGITLSGGQKARITLARAIYAHTEIVLLDDVLAALDVHTSKWIVNKCFSGDLLENRTVILVTHNIALAKPVAGFVVSMGSNGTIASHGSVDEVLRDDERLAQEIVEEEQALTKVEEEIDEPVPEKPAGGKLIIKEEVQEGHVGWPAVKMYLVGLGGRHPILFFLGYFGGCIACQVLMAGQTWYLGHWAEQYEIRDPWEISVTHYLGVYGLLLLAVLCISTAQEVVFIFGGMRASRSLHQQLVQAVLGTTWRWLDTTPISRVLTRCTQDIRAIDGPVPHRLRGLSDITMDMIVKLCAVVLFAPVFLAPGAALLIIGGWCGNLYMASQLAVKREMSNAKAPVLGHLGAAISGLVSIRAYGAQNAFKKEAHVRIDRYSRTGRTFYNLNRWVSVRTDLLGGLFTGSLAIYLLYGKDQSAANTGFSLNMAVGFSTMIMWVVRMFNEFEVQGNRYFRPSVQRSNYLTLHFQP